MNLYRMSSGWGKNDIVARHSSLHLVGRELGGLTNQELAKELQQEHAVLSIGLGKLAEELVRDPALRRLVEALCDSLRKGRRPKKSKRLNPRSEQHAAIINSEIEKWRKVIKDAGIEPQ